jgi:kynurenine formamidase
MAAKRPKIIDLSLPLESYMMEPQVTEIKYITHRELAESRARGYKMSADDFPLGMHCATEDVRTTTHSGTHLDACYHYGPITENGPSRTIDEVPLEWLYGDGVVLDFSGKKPGDHITLEDVKAALQKIRYTVKPWDIVLFRTDTDKHHREWNFDELHPGVDRAAAEWLIDQGVKVMAIDAWGFDRPIPLMLKEYKEGHKEQFFQSHYLGRDREYVHAEKLTNLDKLPPHGFKVALFPIKVKKASGAWIRAVAFLDE